MHKPDLSKIFFALPVAAYIASSTHSPTCAQLVTPQTELQDQSALPATAPSLSRRQRVESAPYAPAIRLAPPKASNTSTSESSPLILGAPETTTNSSAATATPALPPTAPNFNLQTPDTNTAALQAPTIPSVENLPTPLPDINARPPIPTPPAVTLLPPQNNSALRDALGWRAKAYRLRSEPAESKLIRASKTYQASFEDTFAAITQACSSSNIRIDSSFDSAGQILCHMDDAPDKMKIIITVKSLGKTSSVVRVGTDPESRYLKSTAFNDMLQNADNAINQKGLL